MFTKSIKEGQIRLELEMQRKLPFWKSFAQIILFLSIGSAIFFIGIYGFTPFMRIILSVPGVLFWICGLINLKSLTEPYKKAFLIDVKTNTISMEGARSEPLRAWRYSWRFDELEKLYFTEERKGVPNSLKLKIKGRKKPINVEFLRVRGASNGGDMVNLYKEIITLVPSIKSVSDRMLQVYESSLAQWDKGNVPVSDIEVPDIDENGEKTSPSQQ